MSATDSNLWQRACNLLTESSVDCGLERTYPEPLSRMSLLAALASSEVAITAAAHREGAQLASHLSALLAQAATINRIGKCPVVGISGLLNSGKSSLLATYLSEAGRTRVLRGTANNQGTHRFVLWLPEAWWHDADLQSLLQKYLTDLFGVAPERLADDPQAAFAQYNGQLSDTLPSGTDPLTVPLIAHDAGLNTLGLALLDCPDIQTAFSAGQSLQSRSSESIDAIESQNHRRAVLGRVGRLCSAFLVVSKLSSLHDETLRAIFETLRDTMPGVRRILAVNKVKARYTPEVVDEQAQGLVDQYKITDVYMAYDFRSHWAQQRLPLKPNNLHFSTDDPLPIFFKAKAGPTSVKPSLQPILQEESSAAPSNLHPPTVETYLQDLSKLLDPGKLVIESRRSVAEQLHHHAVRALDWVQACSLQREKQLHDAWQTIAAACLSFMAQRDDSDKTIGLRLQTSPAIVAQMSDSLVRAAPWSMRPSLLIDRSVRQLQTSIVGSVKKMRWLQSISSNLTQFVSSFRKGQTGKVVTAERFRQQLERHDYQLILGNWPTESITAACENALSRFQREDTSRLDQEWLDRWSGEVWKSMSLKRKLYVGMMPLAPIFGPLLAVTLIPFDGGGTAVLVFATTKELLLAAGIAAVATPTMTGGEVQDIVERETALTQLSELFAITCDSLGVPRPPREHLPTVRIGNADRELSASHLPVKAPATANSLASWQLAAKYPERLTNALNALSVDINRHSDETTS